MALQIKPTPTRFPTNSLYTPMDNTPLYSISSVCHPWGKLLLLLFRYSAKSLNAQEERLATSPQLVKRLHLPHAIVVRLHVRESNVAILTPVFEQ